MFSQAMHNTPVAIALEGWLPGVMSRQEYGGMARQSSAYELKLNIWVRKLIGLDGGQEVTGKRGECLPGDIHEGLISDVHNSHENAIAVQPQTSICA